MIKELGDKIEGGDVAEPMVMCLYQYYKLYFPKVGIPKRCRDCSLDEINFNCESYVLQEVYDFNRQKFLNSQWML